jgi:hypothetical protein
MGTMDYELIEYEPELNPENISKWQIRKTPMTVSPMRQVFKNHHLAREFPMNREPLDKWLGDWKNFDPTA